MPPTNKQIADGLRACDWSNTPIGNKAIIQAAIDALDPPPKIVRCDRCGTDYTPQRRRYNCPHCLR
jgi:Zn finger protein HypA/HybF involved in hydrogenase expression